VPKQSTQRKCVPFLPQSPRGGLIPSNCPYKRHTMITSRVIMRLMEGPCAGAGTGSAGRMEPSGGGLGANRDPILSANAVDANAVRDAI
jgi:hypothetical protein